jgi:hypothetical protein
MLEKEPQGHHAPPTQIGPIFAADPGRALGIGIGREAEGSKHEGGLGVEVGAFDGARGLRRRGHAEQRKDAETLAKGAGKLANEATVGA